MTATHRRMNGAYDVIVVDAGSAGCVVAGRIAAETSARVLVLEDGGPDLRQTRKLNVF